MPEHDETSRSLRSTSRGLPDNSYPAAVVAIHTVATGGDAVPVSRYAYLGGQGNSSVLDLLEEGGTALFFLETRYLIPFQRLVLPFVGSPVFTVRHIMGSAGVGTLPSLDQELGVGVGLSRFRSTSHRRVPSRGTKVGLGVSLGQTE